MSVPQGKLCAAILLAGILLLGLYCRIRYFYADLAGLHLFRQSHVASNIYYFIQNGISVSTEMFTKNMEYKIFDFPLYQQIVAILCNLLGTDLVLTGRIVNIFIYCVTYLVLYRIMVNCESNVRLMLSVLLFYSLSPLDIFYSRAILPDNLAILLGFQSLLCFLRWQQKKPSVIVNYLGMVLTGILATLIKNPVYLPILISIGVWFVFHGEYRRLYSVSMLFLLIVIAATVIVFKLYTNYVNVHSFSTPTWEYSWYFSNISERLRPITYMRIIDRLFLEIVPPPVCLLCLLGISLYGLNIRNRNEAALVIGLSAGAMVTMFVFLNVNSLHNYYQLPYVFIICFFAGYFVERFWVHLNKLIMHSLRPVSRRILKGLWGIIFWGFILHVTQFYMLPRNEPEALMTAGNFLQANTPPKSFLLYVIRRETYWDPSYLYYAKREGYNIGSSQLNSSFIQDVIAKYKDDYESIYLYVPMALFLEHQKVLSKYYNDYKLVAYSSTNGYLFKLRGL